MRIRWRAPRSLLAVSLGAIGVLIVALAWLGWRLIDQDRELDRRRIQERLSSAADLAVDSIRRNFDLTSARLADLVTSLNAGAPADLATSIGIRGDEAAVITSVSGRVRASVALPFYPDEADPVDLTVESFATAERLELTHHPAAALAELQWLRRSSNADVRAGALLRVARIARSLGQPDVILPAYDELQRMVDATAAGRPADLVASIERCAYLEQKPDPVALARAAADLRAALDAGRWRLSHAAYRYYEAEVERWLGHSTAEQPGSLAEAMSESVVAIWPETAQPTVRRVVVSGRGVPIVMVGVRAGDRFIVIAATPSYAQRAWFGALTTIAGRQRADLTLTAENGRRIFGSSPPAAAAVLRPVAETGLPFDVHVSSADPVADVAVFAGRRRLQAAVIVTLVLLIMAGAYVVSRGVGKELATARLQSDFVSAVSHEFRTPVASVRQLSEMLDEGRVADDDRKAEYYRLLRRESERLERLVEGLLDFGRMESAAKAYRFEPVDVAPFIRQVAAEFSAQYANGHHRIDLAVPDGGARVRADREALGRAIWNLLDNATKYSPEGTAIAIDASEAAGAVRIQVRDEGSGISKEDQERIFEKFVRGASAQAMGARGTGLGLAMVRHIARAHGGEVSVDSAPGIGSTFTIQLPLVPMS